MFKTKQLSNHLEAHNVFILFLGNTLPHIQVSVPHPRYPGYFQYCRKFLILSDQSCVYLYNTFCIHFLIYTSFVYSYRIFEKLLNLYFKHFLKKQHPHCKVPCKKAFQYLMYVILFPKLWFLKHITWFIPHFLGQYCTNFLKCISFFYLFILHIL